MNKVTIKTIVSTFDVLSELWNFQQSGLVWVTSIPDFRGYTVHAKQFLRKRKPIQGSSKFKEITKFSFIFLLKS